MSTFVNFLFDVFVKPQHPHVDADPNEFASNCQTIMDDIERSIFLHDALLRSGSASKYAEGSSDNAPLRSTPRFEIPFLNMLPHRDEDNEIARKFNHCPNYNEFIVRNRHDIYKVELPADTDRENVSSYHYTISNKTLKLNGNSGT